VFTGGRRGEVRAWNYKTGADLWQNTRLAPDPDDRLREVVPERDPDCTLLVYGIRDFDEQQLGDVLVARKFASENPKWVSICPRKVGGSSLDGIKNWALVGMATKEDAKDCLAQCKKWTKESWRPHPHVRFDDGRVLKMYAFDPARADERDLLGFGAMRMTRQDRGRPVTALALHESDGAQVRTHQRSSYARARGCWSAHNSSEN
jgi:hypothetical protein